VVGEHSRSLVALAIGLDAVVILLCQLYRNCEERPNKRPITSYLAMSGSTSRMPRTSFSLPRWVYNPESPDKDISGVYLTKQRRCEIGAAVLA
jgi:replicative DNA helicase